MRSGRSGQREEVVVNQLTSERNDQTLWDPIVI